MTPYEKYACRLLEELNIGQSTLSFHMKILCGAVIVTGFNINVFDEGKLLL